ncbi:HD domain-containing protein [Desulfitobacterium metallireducens]|uniref:Phosphohydrolase n=1 Tax=Desulfitobacterium metallireducens DSM 15288 TaxID=871968 RepID=W0E8A9_9FIRM|nr:HD domain-containing protein [Desulfitobacterium metallireducens]AHF05738.1 phosphohydrolase [Desulfitobacterium metallireducens DSM 15288]
MVSVPRVNRIIENPLFIEYSHKNNQAEQKRAFCKHGFDHGLAVARIAYIYLLEDKNTSLSKEVVYAAAVLHDLGRWREYETGEDHALFGADLIKPILRESGFTPGEVEVITQGIREHRLDPEGELSPLGRALAYADDWARDCRSCRSQVDCYKYSGEMDEIKS